MSRSNDAKDAKVAYREDQLSINVVMSHREFDQIRAVRAICFMEEHELGFGEANDANDFQASHVLLKCDDEPIGCSRMRWFHGFAQVDRTAVRPAYRTDIAVKKIVDFVIGHAAKKGFPKVVTHAAPLYARLWTRRYGFRSVEGRPPLKFDGYPDALIELERETVLPNNAITDQSPPHIIHRIEGAWDQPTKLEGGPKPTPMAEWEVGRPVRERAG